MRRKWTDEQIIDAMRRLGSPSEAAKELGITVRGLYDRRSRIEEKHGIKLESFSAPQKFRNTVVNRNQCLTHEIRDGTMMIASDAHYWPNEETVAHKAFVKLAKKLKPDSVVMNGDVFDGARVSRHDPLYRSETPTVKQEIEACQDRLSEIRDATKNSKFFWTYGNHDIRVWRYLSKGAPELAGLMGTDLFDHFPGWHHGWMMEVNSEVIIKHRFTNGVHSTYNATLRSGRTMVNGHLHKLQVTGYTDYNGRRWGIDSGTLASIVGDQFGYTEGNPVNWASGFVVLTFKNGRLLHPEICEVIDEVPYFRGSPV